LVTGFPRLDANIFLVRQHFQERHTGNRIGVHEGGTGQIDHRGNLVGIAQDAWFVLLCAEHLQPRQAAAQNEQSQQKKGSPKKTQFDLAGRLFKGVTLRLRGLRSCHA
jgi:hypothetical protein